MNLQTYHRLDSESYTCKIRYPSRPASPIFCQDPHAVELETFILSVDIVFRLLFIFSFPSKLH